MAVIAYSIITSVIIIIITIINAIIDLIIVNSIKKWITQYNDLKYPLKSTNGKPKLSSIDLSKSAPLLWGNLTATIISVTSVSLFLLIAFKLYTISNSTEL
jgi:hypothetical protein